MNSARFKEIYEGLTNRESGLLALKGSEYATDNEVLANFIKAALIEGRRPSEVALSYMTKHFLSVQKAIEIGNFELYWEKSKPNGDRDECIVQRIADLRNYALFVLCCMEYEKQMPVDFGTLVPKVPTTAEIALRELWTPEIMKILSLDVGSFIEALKSPYPLAEEEVD